MSESDTEKYLIRQIVNLIYVTQFFIGFSFLLVEPTLQKVFFQEIRKLANDNSTVKRKRE